MKIAAIGDIHSNHIALEKCLDWVYSHDIDGMVFLGDYVTDCPYPQRTMDILRSIPERYLTWFVRGNREDYIIKYRKDPTGWSYGSRTGALLYTYENLTDEAIDWLETMPMSADIHIDGCDPMRALHCPPYFFPRQKQPPAELLQKTVSEMTTSVLLCAHSHVPLVYKQDGRLIVNSGSLGVPNGPTGAHFALLEYNGGWNAEIIHLDYDIETACAEFEESGLLERSHIWGIGTREMLRTGIEYAVNTVDEVTRLLKNDPELTETEELWCKAARNVGLDI